VRIHFKEEQDFLVDYIFEKNGIADAVWIGAHIEAQGDKYKWMDNSELTYANWTDGSPSTVKDHCVKLIPEYRLQGKWMDVAFKKNNVVVCQKAPTLPMSTLQDLLLELQHGLKKTRNELSVANQKLFESNQNLEKTKKDLLEMKQNPLVPISFIYVQLPGEKSPTEVWLWMQWADVSATYAGAFFRVDGGGVWANAGGECAPPYRSGV